MDEGELADEHITRLLNADVDQVRQKASLIPAGVEGDCELCGEHFARIVRGACARCRDKHKLP